jgi:hypothetical protein
VPPDPRTERLVGFDVKLLDPARTAQAWPRARRESYLLRPDVANIVSVDPMVTPSHFGEAAVKTPSDTPRWSWRHMGLGVWADLDAMRAAAGTSGAAVAITAPDPATFAADTRWIEAAKESTNPDTPQPSWNLIGYDVADIHFLSGMSNCGLHPDEYAVLRPIHAAHINDLGLFATLDAALAFRRRIDTLAAEHAPFYPFGIWRM